MNLILGYPGGGADSQLSNGLPVPARRSPSTFFRGASTSYARRVRSEHQPPRTLAGDFPFQPNTQRWCNYVLRCMPPRMASFFLFSRTFEVLRAVTVGWVICFIFFHISLSGTFSQRTNGTLLDLLRSFLAIRATIFPRVLYLAFSVPVVLAGLFLLTSARGMFGLIVV